MKSIIESFSEHGTFIQPDALAYITGKEKPSEFVLFLKKNLHEYPLILTIDHIKDVEKSLQTIEKVKPETQQQPINKELQNKLLLEVFTKKHRPDENGEEFDEDDDEETLGEQAEKSAQTPILPEIKTIKGWKPVAREYDAEVRIIKDITDNSMCEGTTSDFVRLFRDRYLLLSKIIRSQRREMMNVLPINRIKRSMTDINLIGIVKTVKNTANGHRLIELEDETGTRTVMALKNNLDVFQLASEVIVDEIIGVTGRISKNGELVILNHIVFPDIKLHNDRHHAPDPVYAAFLSDVHIGSKMFLSDEWNAFLRWINGAEGNSRQKDVASKIKYLVLPGDLVDGIGIYPNQEKELAITNIYEQYEHLAKQLQFIPEHITILLQPGNHDAVRPAEPQPTFEKEIRDLFTGRDFRFLGNPCYFSLHGVEILSYHGQSLLDFSTNIQHIAYNQPTEAMKIMLKKRHLAPVYGGYTPLAPEHSDYLIIDKVPDLFVTGHVHTTKIDTYRGVTLINASSWQAQTTYQKMLNFVPDSAKLPIVDLKTGNATTMDFSH